jgi:hypothetical protein
MRQGARRSWLFRRALVWLDDLFYGRRPPGRAADLAARR